MVQALFERRLDPVVRRGGSATGLCWDAFTSTDYRLIKYIRSMKVVLGLTVEESMFAIRYFIGTVSF